MPKPDALHTPSAVEIHITGGVQLQGHKLTFRLSITRPAICRLARLAMRKVSVKDKEIE